MSGRMATYRTIAQRRTECVIGTGLGFATAFALHALTSIPPVLLPIVILVPMLAVIGINSWLLAKHGAPTLPPEEINERLWTEIAARPPLYTVGEWILGFTAFLTGMFVLVEGPAAFAPDMLPLYAFLPVAGGLSGWRRVRMARAKTQASTLPPETSIGFAVLRFYFVLALALAAGTGISFMLPAPWRVFAILFGMLAGMSAVPMKHLRHLQQSCAELEGNAPIFRTMAWGVILWGVPMALFSVAMICTQLPDHSKTPLTLALLAAAAASIAVVMGLGFGALMWIFGAAQSWGGSKSRERKNARQD